MIIYTDRVSICAPDERDREYRRYSPETDSEEDEHEGIAEDLSDFLIFD